MTNSSFKFVFLLLSVFFILGSCSDPKEEAIAHLESMNYDVYMPVDDAVAEQNNAISDFMKKMQNKESINVPEEIAAIEQLRLKSVEVLLDAKVSAAKVPDFGDKAGLKYGTLDYIEAILKFENDLGPALNGLKDGLNPVGIMEFSKQIGKGKEMVNAKNIYIKVKSDFANEYGITALDQMQMQLRH